MNKIQQAILKQKITLLLKSNQLDDAEKIALQVLHLSPNDTEILMILGQLNEQKKHYEQAVEFYYRLANLEIPTETRNSLLEHSVDVCNKQFLYKLGLITSEAFLKAKPNDAKALFFCGFFSYHIRYLFKAIDYLTKANKADENNIWCLNYLGLSYSHMGQSRKALPYFQKSMVLDPDSHFAEKLSLYGYNFIDQISEKEVSQAHKNFGAQLESNVVQHQFKKPEHLKTKIRIGYVSACFWWHSVGYFFKAALEGQSRNQFEIFCYSDVEKPDDMTATLQASSDHWLETRSLSDQQLFEQILQDKIDILVDLTGYMEDTRLPVFTRKAAPIQVTYLGYPNTTGLSTIDYRLTDPWADTSASDPFYTETLVRLPTGFLCYYPDKDAPRVSSLPADNIGHICFGSFNTFQKITQQVIALWSRLLQQVPHSTLLIKAQPLQDEEFCNWVFEQFESTGTTRERIELLGWMSEKQSHLSLYDRIDVHLDTFPYHGTTTTCEALWQGVPTITLAGKMHRERVGVSIMSQVGLEQFIAQTPDDYVSIAANIAENLDTLRSIRIGMRERMKESALMDVDRFSTSLAEAYSLMYKSYVSG